MKTKLQPICEAISVRMYTYTRRYTYPSRLPAFSKAHTPLTLFHKSNAESRKRRRPTLCRSTVLNCKNIINIDKYYHSLRCFIQVKLIKSSSCKEAKGEVFFKIKVMKIKKTHPQTCWSKTTLV